MSNQHVKNSFSAGIFSATATNKVDPDQTSDQGLHCYLSEQKSVCFVPCHFSRRHLVYIFPGMLRLSCLEYLLVCITLQEFIFEIIQCNLYPKL